MSARILNLDAREVNERSGGNDRGMNTASIGTEFLAQTCKQHVHTAAQDFIFLPRFPDIFNLVCKLPAHTPLSSPAIHTC